MQENQNAYCSNWRKASPHKPERGEQIAPYPATKFFDQLSFIGNSKYACFVLECSEGLILLDCLTRDPAHITVIEQGISELGLDISKLKAILITHGHGDHYGHADYFRQKYGTKIYMSQIDFQYARAANEPGDIFPDGPMPFKVDAFIEDAQSFSLGDTSICIIGTPGHTPGCLSFLIPVTDEGRPHLIALWGGTGIPAKRERQEQYLQSWYRFAKLTEEYGVDGEISNHPFVDMMLPRLEIVRNIVDGVPNPFVLGKRNYKYYEKSFCSMCVKKMQLSEKTCRNL